MPQITAIILAAGSSRRMGRQNKLLLPVEGEVMVRRVVQRVSGLIDEGLLDDCIVVLGHEADKVKEALAGLPVSFVYNERYAEGMGTSLAVAAAAVDESAVDESAVDESVGGVMIALADMPYITTDEYRDIVRGFNLHLPSDAALIAAPVFEGRRGNPVILSVQYLPEIKMLKGDAGCRDIIRENKQHLHAIKMGTPNIFRDVDTPRDTSETTD